MRIKALMAFNQPFIPLESPSTKSRLTQAKLVYFLMQLVIMGMGVYKVWIMGLLPTTGSDFLAWKSERPVCQRSPFVYVEANFAGHGMECCVKLHSNLAICIPSMYVYIILLQCANTSGITMLCQCSPRPIPTNRQPKPREKNKKLRDGGIWYFSRNISNTVNIPFRCFSPFSSYFLTENFSTREERMLGNCETSKVLFITVVLSNH